MDTLFHRHWANVDTPGVHRALATGLIPASTTQLLRSAVYDYDAAAHTLSVTAMEHLAAALAQRTTLLETHLTTAYDHTMVDVTLVYRDLLQYTSTRPPQMGTRDPPPNPILRPLKQRCTLRGPLD